MTVAAIEILRSQSLPTLLEAEIERVILGGEYAPGDRINEKEIALRFGISRGPVREALRSLAAGGLVEVTPNVGVSVRRLGAHQAAEIYEVRGALFGLAGQLLAARVTEANIEAMRGFVRRMDAAITAQDFATYVTENFALHDFIVDHAGNAVLAAQYRALVKQLRLYRARNLHSVASVRESNCDHHEMVEALAARDAARAQTAHRDHVLRARQRLLSNPELS